ncbi:MAG: hypothetical protein IJU44_10720 [Kiritimatiellae bacterium]|nr:hypothetical protein [Kiritimatiellia bacterium]
MRNKISAFAFLILAMCVSGCLYWDSGYTVNRPVAAHRISAANRVPVSFNVTLIAMMPEAFGCPDELELREKVQAALKATGVFSEVTYAADDGASYHLNFVFRQGGLSPVAEMNSETLSLFSLGLIPMVGTCTLDGAVTCTLGGQQLYATVRAEKLRRLTWLPLLPAAPFCNAWTAWDAVSGGIVNALAEAAAEEHCRRYSSATVTSTAE